DENDMAQLLRVDIDGWLQEIPLIREYFESFGDHLPAELDKELDELEDRLQKAKQAAA
ncbi:MAG: phosphoenolpyruvate carboxykinase (GTP), partial [Gammaproteobacteria bacterium]|nr:phosphoenolpyruvate carboxykinase (GTP) [Gammaproteobacteria bacterium]NIO63453.1 phosphoenolpyruvate carboxykinase (GTP) [Gammaproteobacteria bacterium]